MKIERRYRLANSYKKMDEPIRIYQCYKYQNQGIVAWILGENRMICWKYKEDDKDILRKMADMSDRLKKEKACEKPLVFLHSEKEEVAQIRKKLGMSASEDLVVFR